jgi:hypothetical protein
VLFHGLYNEVRIAWDGSRYIQFSLNGFDIFENSVATDLPITGVASSENQLITWVNTAQGAKLCRAAVGASIRPGDTSWAIKPLDNNETQCGCSSMGWTGRGAYYGGTEPNCTGPCTCWGGSFVGVKDNGQQKSDVTGYDTWIYIR